ncbi:LCP family protein [Limnoraphis robusta]|uniref:LCP family protein n=1 Tax=Limnoraphis robusta CCNP1315 TaxID=3110306 RepID=A0ABU5U329_9CYAN|nr:LCP family protein [Limnoraphis robusta]MEA5521470.1 LCP family protein [Limnoraphis robusta CCNP1315]MEA5546447.1 LCP family protein [Limnoraphis robusta CCNP1324]
MTFPPSSASESTSPRRMSWGVVIVLAALLSAILGAITAAFLPTDENTPDPASNVLNEFWRDRFGYKLTRPVNILVMGIDRTEDTEANSLESFQGRSDTILLVQFDPKTSSISSLSIPRDTEVEIPGFGRGKINEANYWGGTELARQTVHNTLNQIPIHRYVRVSSGAFKELVDLLGGVDVLIPHPMSYIDNTQQLKIDLSPGWQTINGEQADQFARYRSDAYGDIGRIQRQQALIEAIQKRLQNPNILPRLPQMIRVMQKYIDTDLSFNEILSLVNFGLNLESQQFKMVTLPGRSSTAEETYSSYWVIDEIGRDRILAEYFQQDLDTQLESKSLPLDLKIAIQNASGNSQAAEKIADTLANQGYYNVYIVPDWPNKQRQTQIIVQRGNLSSAEALKNKLGWGEIEASSTGEIGSDFTLRIGSDWVNQF